MKYALHTSLLAAALAFSSASIDAAGFDKLSVSDADQPPLEVGVWYPSKSQVATEPNTKFGMAYALDGTIDNANGKLVIISHGYSGWFAGHADTANALAEAGFIVAAPSHTGNTWSDMSSQPSQWALDRPRHISRVIDHLLASEKYAKHINDQHIGVYGFSAGGFTALSLLGAVPDLEFGAQRCAADPSEFVCAEGLLAQLHGANLQALPSQAWNADSRISAAVIAAPGLGFSYTKASLANVKADIQLWSGALDQSVPTASNAAWLASNLPKAPEFIDVQNANHFAFLVMPCREAFKKEDPVEYEVICGDKEGFDRYAFHEDMHQQMIRFFNESFQ